MAWNSKKSGLKDYAVIGGVAVVALLGFIFFTAAGKSIKDKITALFKSKTV